MEMQVELELTGDVELDDVLLEEALDEAREAEGAIVLGFGPARSVERLNVAWQGSRGPGDEVLYVGSKSLELSDSAVLHGLVQTAYMDETKDCRFVRINDGNSENAVTSQLWLCRVRDCVAAFNAVAQATESGDRQALRSEIRNVGQIANSVVRDGLRASIRSELKSLYVVCELEKKFFGMPDDREASTVRRLTFLEDIARNPTFLWGGERNEVAEQYFGREVLKNRQDFVRIGRSLRERAFRRDANGIVNLLVWWSAYFFWRSVKLREIERYSEAIVMCVRSLETYLQSNLLESGVAEIAGGGDLRVRNKKMAGVGGLIRELPLRLRSSLGEANETQLRHVIDLRNRNALGHGTSYACAEHAHQCVTYLQQGLQKLDAIQGGAWRALVRKCSRENGLDVGVQFGARVLDRIGMSPPYS
ncbi:hypothetical protein [Arhodomonas sp. AD133]|uniref:hypothetical protein n=1 Tax=Arhodomonas sp. AD133 TaxID=3415009 RepID=UPI003EBCE6DE